MTFLIPDNYYCPSCGTSNDEEKVCCGVSMLERQEAEGFGLSDFEPSGSGSYDLMDDWN